MYIWQQANWGRFTLNLAQVQPKITAARLAQGRLLGFAAGLGLADTETLALHGWVQEALATAGIEGEQLPLHSVRASAARRLGLNIDLNSGINNGINDARAEATLDVLQAAQQHSSTRIMDHKTLWAWQAALFPTGRSAGVHIQVGAYRNHPEPMQIVTPVMGKNDIIHYQAPPSSQVMAEMERFLAWLNDTNKAPELADRLVQAAVAHLWFEAIHPFEDGNGRIGRAISEWVIAQDGHSPLRLMSVSQQLLIKRKAYYAGLQSMVKPVHWDNQGEAAIDLTDWANWFLGCIAGACDASFDHMQGAAHKTRFWQGVMLKLPELSPAQRKVLNTVFDAQPDGFKGGLSTQLYAKIAKLSRATAYRDLTLLCDAGVLLRTGTGRGTRYRLHESSLK